MDPRELMATLAPGANVREVAAGDNKIFRIIEEDGTSSVIKVYATASRERRERHALEALAGTLGVPAILDRGTEDDTPWIKMVDGGAWTLATLPENHQLARRAGAILRAVHDTAGSAISNLEEGMNGDWVGSHYFSTVRRLERYRRRLMLSPDLLSRALTSPPPRGGKPRPSHTNPRPGKFVVNDAGDVLLIDWEWGTLAPPEWDLSLALWRMRLEVTAAAADALHAGYGATLPDDRLRPWIAFHAARWMLEAAERRDGRLGDLDYLRDELEAALAHT